VLDDGGLGMLGYGVRSFDGGGWVRLFGCVRVLGRSSSSSNDSSGVLSMFNGLLDDRMDFACCRLGCGRRSRVMGRVLLVIVGSG